MVGMVGTALSTMLKLELNKAKIGIHNNNKKTPYFVVTSHLFSTWAIPTIPLCV
jgi:hypothetical protein